MSTYSTQINIILRDRLVPQMRGLSFEVAKIEPYSYSNTKLEDSKRQLDYLSMVYDFLYEYAYGMEQLDNGKLINVVRLLDPPTRERKTLDMLSKTITKPKVTSGYKLYIDKLEYFPANSELTPGSTVTITVVYTTTAKLTGVKGMALTVDTVAQTNSSFTATVQNKSIPLEDGGKNLVVTAQATIENNGVVSPIGTVETFTIPIANLIDSTFYYGSAAAGRSAVQIQGLTQFWSPRQSQTLLFSPVNQVYYFAYPINYGSLTSILDDNGFNVISDFTHTTDKLFTLSSPNFSGGTAYYNVYEFNNLTTQTDFSITFNF